MSTIRPEVTIDEGVSPPTISVAVNGTTSTANLPAGNGGHWEDVDLDGIPTDWSENDIIYAVCIAYIQTYNIETWNTEIPNITIGINVSYPSVIIATLGENSIELPAYAKDRGESIEILNISAGRLDQWNRGRDYFMMRGITFNGNNMQIATKTINNENIKDYITVLKRWVQ